MRAGLRIIARRPVLFMVGNSRRLARGAPVRVSARGMDGWVRAANLFALLALAGAGDAACLLALQRGRGFLPLALGTCAGKRSDLLVCAGVGLEGEPRKQHVDRRKLRVSYVAYGPTYILCRSPRWA